ncbi:MAG: hypothetical protein JNL56_08075 [Alphaproteobacteria bacterium]|nr:hypothetical protein [Alphaproteobacteria bacterium]
MSERFPTSLICDYAGRGEKNKHIAVGIYSGDILVAAFPAQLKFAAYIEFYPPRSGDMKIEAFFSLNGTRTAGIIGKAMGVKDTEIAAMTVPSLDFNFQSPGTLDLYMRFDSDEPLLVRSKKVLLSPSPLPNA